MSNIVKNALCAFWLLDLNYVVLLKNARFTMLFYCFYTSKKLRRKMFARKANTSRHYRCIFR